MLTNKDKNIVAEALKYCIKYKKDYLIFEEQEYAMNSILKELKNKNGNFEINERYYILSSLLDFKNKLEKDCNYNKIETIKNILNKI